MALETNARYLQTGARNFDKQSAISSRYEPIATHNADKPEAAYEMECCNVLKENIRISIFTMYIHAYIKTFICAPYILTLIY